MNLLVPVFIVAVFAAALFAALMRKLITRSDDTNSHAEWLDGFSIETYRPMERLLNEADYAFLAAQPGYEPAIASRLRAERKQIFRAYLRRLVVDFERFVQISRLIMVHSATDRPELASAIFKLRVRFYLAVVRTEIALSIPSMQLDPSRGQSLVKALAAMNRSVAELVPGPLAV